MRKTILTLALAASTFGASAAFAQTTPPAPPPPHGPAMRADGDYDRVITRAQAIARADARFAQIDTDHDGMITAREMQAYREAMRDRMIASGRDVPTPPPGGPKHMPGMGRKADPDGDHRISRAEYAARAVERFDRMDSNHDGRIDQTDRAAMRDVRRGGRHDGMMPPPPPVPAPAPRQ